MKLNNLIPLLTIMISISNSCSYNNIKENKKVVELAENHWLTYTDIIIDAPPDLIWETLTDWDNIKTWSSSLKTISGERNNNGKVIVSYLVEGKLYEDSHTFIFIEGKEFGWSDHMTGSFSGLEDNHKFKLEIISENKTLFIQSDDFKGKGNQNVSAKDVAYQTINFFPQFNRELKKEVESRIRK